MFIHKTISNISSKINILNDKFNYYSEGIRDVGSGLIVANLFAFFTDDSFGYEKFIQEGIISCLIWYIGGKLKERSKNV